MQSLRLDTGAKENTNGRQLAKKRWLHQDHCVLCTYAMGRWKYAYIYLYFSHSLERFGIKS